MVEWVRALDYYAEGREFDLVPQLKNFIMGTFFELGKNEGSKKRGMGYAFHMLWPRHSGLSQPLPLRPPGNDSLYLFFKVTIKMLNGAMPRSESSHEIVHYPLEEKQVLQSCHSELTNTQNNTNRNKKTFHEQRSVFLGTAYATAPYVHHGSQIF